ncbi:hypothetical protein OIU78_001202 [Salix suchowensis]|nr:hypothetical protein OIU78_001202 [Salix suchowensis]
MTIAPLPGYIPNDCGRKLAIEFIPPWFFVHRISNIIPGQLDFPERVPLYRSDAFSSTEREIHFKAVSFSQNVSSCKPKRSSQHRSQLLPHGGLNPDRVRASQFTVSFA